MAPSSRRTHRDRACLAWPRQYVFYVALCRFSQYFLPIKNIVPGFLRHNSSRFRLAMTLDDLPHEQVEEERQR